jgi:hypothetical protein
MMIYIKTISITTFAHILVLHPFQYPDGSMYDEPTNVEESADELCLEVKCHSNPDLAGSP